MQVLGAGGAAEWAGRYDKLQVVEPGWVVGAFENVEAAVRAQGGTSGGGAAGAAGSGGAVVINVVWGCGTWGFTQVLAEIARGGWGIVTVEEYLKIRPDDSLQMDWLLDFGWTRVLPLARLAPATEYMERGRRGR